MIQDLEGHEEACTHRKDGTIVWKVVPSHSVTQDNFAEVQEEEELSTNLPVTDVKKYIDKNNYSKCFWALWSTDHDKDIAKLNNE